VHGHRGKGEGSLTAVATSGAAFRQVRPLTERYLRSSRLGCPTAAASGSTVGRACIRAGQNVFACAQLGSNQRPLACKTRKYGRWTWLDVARRAVDQCGPWLDVA
jgi:hypothetical protein